MNKFPLMRRQFCFGTLLPAFAISYPMSSSVYAAEQTGGGVGVMQEIVAGHAGYGGMQIPYLFGRMDSPTRPDKLGGTSLIFMPPIDVVRMNGEPRVFLSDPRVGGNGLLVEVEGRKSRIATAKELAALVQNGSIPPTTPTMATFALQLHDDLGVKEAVHQALIAQLQRIEDPAAAAFKEWSGDDMQRYRHAIYMIPPKKMTLTCAVPGIEALRVQIDNGPNLRNELIFQAQVPALLVSHLFSDGGLNFSLEFSFDVYKEQVTTGWSSQVADALISALQSDEDDGKTPPAAGSGRYADVPILATSNRIENLQKSLRGNEQFLFRGGSTADLEFVGNFIQRMEQNVFSATADDVQEHLKLANIREDFLRKPGVVESLKKLHSNQAFSEEEYDKLVSDFNSSASQSQGGAAFSLGFVSFGGGGGNQKQNTTARKTYDHDLIRKFASDLYDYHESGSWPKHPRLDYRLVSKAKFTQQFEQFVQTQRAGNVGTAVRSTHCNSSVPSLKRGAVDILPTISDVLEQERKLRGAQE